MYSDFTVIIPVKNEILHIERSIKSAQRLTSNVVVVDSASTDGTIEMAESLGAKVIQYEWTSASSFASKMNWAINNSGINTTWAIRLDADEYFTEECISGLAEALSKFSSNVNGGSLRRRIYFMGKWMKHGSCYPVQAMRILRIGKAEYRERWLDEYIDLKGGDIVNLDMDVIDDSKITIGEWINKHNGYSNREVIELLNSTINLEGRNISLDDNKAGSSSRAKSKKKYAKMPLYWRAFMYFCVRYFLQLAILDGKAGFVWTFMHAFWYRTLCDVKYEELINACGTDKKLIQKYIKDNYNISVDVQ